MYRQLQPPSAGLILSLMIRIPEGKRYKDNTSFSLNSNRMGIDMKDWLILLRAPEVDTIHGCNEEICAIIL